MIVVASAPAERQRVPSETGDHAHSTAMPRITPVNPDVLWMSYPPTLFICASTLALGHPDATSTAPRGVGGRARHQRVTAVFPSGSRSRVLRLAPDRLAKLVDASFAMHACGILGDGERKSAEPIAARSISDDEDSASEA